MVIGIQDELLRINSLGLLDRLLADRTTKANILWATDAYTGLGPDYQRDREIRAELITGERSGVIKNRARKALEQQSARTRQHAEVFTPNWVCAKMCDYADEVWFGRPNAFFKDGEPTDRVQFPKRKSWKRYVDDRRMEITCGEAPFLVSRYDVSNGEIVPLERRTGLLDRKLRAVGENTDTEEEWLQWALRAFQATWGYEFQGDNLLIARLNLLMTFEEYLSSRWKRKPTKQEYETIANIIAWNLWQMDGLTYTIPYRKPEEEGFQFDFFEDMGFPAEEEKTQPYCRIYDWRKRNSFEFQELRRRKGKMKFNFIIGNPPYQDETLGENKTFAPPIYHQFLEEAYKVSDIVELVHPARFLFNAGSTPKSWNQKMLNDPHMKVILYKADVSEVFPGTNINGGIAITYRNAKEQYAPIEVFTQFDELNQIRNKICNSERFSSLSAIIFSAYSYHFTDELYKEHPELFTRLSKGHEYDFKSNILELMPEIFSDIPFSQEYVSVLGRKNNNRTIMWTMRKYVKGPSNMDKYKVFLAGADGAAGTIGKPIPARVMGIPSVGQIGMCATESFVSIGSFDTEDEARNAENYLKTKLARSMLSILKVTQAITPDKFKYVPLQDFTPASDIDWSRSIPEIDQQLYAKYGLDEAEIAFIESHVKEMS